MRSLVMDVEQAGALNLAGFVQSTAGRIGSVKPISGGVAVAGPVAVPNGYVNTAIPTDPMVSAAEFFEEAISFFAGLERVFVLWAPLSDSSFANEAAERGLVPDKEPSPAMVISAQTNVRHGLRLRLVDDEASAAVFGDLCERGYEKPGMAWLLAAPAGLSCPRYVLALSF